MKKVILTLTFLFTLAGVSSAQVVIVANVNVVKVKTVDKEIRRKQPYHYRTERVHCRHNHKVHNRRHHETCVAQVRVYPDRRSQSVQYRR